MHCERIGGVLVRVFGRRFAAEGYVRHHRPGHTGAVEAVRVDEGGGGGVAIIYGSQVVLSAAQICWWRLVEEGLERGGRGIGGG